MIHHVAVVGATGMLGQPVVKALLSAGYSVKVITRDVTKAKCLFNNVNVAFIQADIFDEESLKKALQGAEAIHINLSGNSPQSYIKNHVEGTQNILKCSDTRSTKLISMISTATAYPENNVRADTKAKLDAERLLKESPYPYISFMPSWFYETLNLLVDGDNVTTMCNATQKLHWLSADDFAQSVVQSYANLSLYNRRLTLIGPQKLTLIEAANQYAHTKGLNRVHLSNDEAKAYANEVNDDTLIDAVDLLEYTELVGENIAPETLAHPLKHTTTLSKWLATN
ncbi:SDR family oxidoreductase [Thalassotalea marina]|uniref:NAD(P)-binding domain-containing protein n=1 Tax=Thalassotalea marina TaxID=1673741 RepID=A0A919EJD9_9GAMM|nr:NAD(P)H-binding protein [Thalassotalea marina]GHF85951.1 hypothetical protein GCM10017161_11980 [Thalassotalea marina]